MPIPSGPCVASHTRRDATACQRKPLAFLVMREVPKARYMVTIAGHRPVDRELADSQATGDACIRCNATDVGELVPLAWSSRLSVAPE